MSTTFGIILVVALQEEAQPLIERLSLVKRPNTHLAIYENSSIILVVSGVGIVSTCTAVGYTANLFNKRNPLFWLNIGTAGHKHLSIGTVVIPAKILAISNHPPFFPTPIFYGKHETTELMSVIKPNGQYHETFCADMEAIGFCLASIRFSLKDYVHVVKIISDNETLPISTLKKGGLGEVIRLKLGVLTDIIRQFTNFAEQESEHKVVFSLPSDLQNIHFTETQKVNLFHLLSQLSVFVPEASLKNLNIDKKNASSVLKSISSLVEKKLPKFDHD